MASYLRQINMKLVARHCPPVRSMHKRCHLDLRVDSHTTGRITQFLAAWQNMFVAASSMSFSVRDFLSQWELSHGLVHAQDLQAVRIGPDGVAFAYRNIALHRGAALVAPETGANLGQVVIGLGEPKEGQAEEYLAAYRNHGTPIGRLIDWHNSQTWARIQMRRQVGSFWAHADTRLLGSCENTVVLWDVRQKQCRGGKGHEGTVVAGALGPNVAVTACTAGELRVWPSGELLERMQNVTALAMTDTFLVVAHAKEITVFKYIFT